VTITTGVEIAAIDRSAGGVGLVETTSGERLEADLIVGGVGVVPNIELAAEAGLDCDNGIVVDTNGRTSDARIFAAGDCAAYRHPFAGRLIRLESVHNAIDQAKTVASSIAGRPRPYDAVPWFWSDQFDVKLQMVGLTAGCDRYVVRGDIEARRFSVFHYAGTTLRSVDSVNRPADHVFGRRALAAGLSPSPEAIRDTAVDLKGLIG
jgi:3-phenylpropionate/trans-cinnamate dioxygenase ferredoxin reductase subunit